ncbi:MAG: hypothetical protein R3E66_17985 [bacterium]
MLIHHMHVLTAVILLGGCASDGPTPEDRNPDAIIQHDWDADVRDSDVTDATGVGSVDVGTDGETAIESEPNCAPAFGSTFDLDVGAPLIVAAKFLEIRPSGDQVLSNPAVRTQVNRPFQTTFTDTFGSVDFTFDSLLTISVEQDAVVRAVGKVAWKQGEVERVEENVNVCLTAFGDFLSYDFDIDEHQIHVQFYTRKDS